MKFCEKLCVLRKINSLSQEQLADKLNVSRQSIFKWESGENTPEIERLKQISKLFNVSLDYLLNDEYTIDNPSVNQSQSQKPITQYRDTFDTGKELDLNEADFNHGYAKESKVKNRDSSEFFETRLQDMINYLEDKGYEELQIIQPDLACCFFFDLNNQLFGLYHSGAIQFLCPFENIISYSTNQSGIYNNISNQSVGGISFGSSGINGVGIGSLPVTAHSGPEYYQFFISYITKDGKCINKEIEFTSNHLFYLLEESDSGFWSYMKNILSDVTSKKLAELIQKLNSYLTYYKEQNSNTTLKKINLAVLNEDAKKAEIKRRNQLVYITQDAKRKNNIKLVITIGVVAIVAVIAIIIVISVCNLAKQLFN